MPKLQRKGNGSDTGRAAPHAASLASQPLMGWWRGGGGDRSASSGDAPKAQQGHEHGYSTYI